jgi:hypothetical protein
MFQSDDARSSDSAEYHRQIALLSELVANPNPWEYMDETTIPSAYESSLRDLQVSQVPSQRASRRILDRKRPFIQPLIEPLFTDIHTLFFEAQHLADSPPSVLLASNWNSCYSEIYTTTKHKHNVDAFLDVIPYFLTQAILSIYLGLPTPLGIAPPSRLEIAARIVYLFTSIHYLESLLEREMSRFFGPQENIVSAPYRPTTTVLLPLETLDDLVDLERRPRDVAKSFRCGSRSPMSQKRKTRVPVSSLGLLYPRNGERTFREDLKPFSLAPKAIDDFSADLETRSLLMRARCSRVEYGLRVAKMEGSLQRINLMHRFQQDRESIELKRRTVANASPEIQQKFMDQLNRNQSKGIFFEDPAVTLDLLREGTFEPVVLAPLTSGKRGKTEQIVDAVLNESAVEHRRKTDIEIHCTREERNAIMDVTRILKERPLPP